MLPLLTNFDPFLDFYKTNPQLRIILKDYLKVPSKHMWALFLYAHPESKFYDEAPSTRKSLIYKDYLESDPTFSWEAYEALLSFIEEKCLSKAQRALMRWEKALHERDDFFASIPYSETTYELKDKMLANTTKLWDQYQSVQVMLSKEQASKTHGDLEESFIEKLQS